MTTPSPTSSSRTPLDRAFAWLAVISLIITGLAAAYLLLLERGFPLPYIQVSNLHQLILVGAEAALIFWLLTLWRTSQPFGPRARVYLLIFFLVNFFLARPFLAYYTAPARQEIPLVRAAQPLLQWVLPGLLAASALLALLSVRELRAFHRWLAAGLDASRAQQAAVADARAAAFAQQHSRLAGLPVLGPLLQGIWRQGLFFWGLLAGIVLLGLLLRLWNLDALPPFTDEYRHLGTARLLLEGTPLSQIAYRRSLYTVTLPVFASFKLFGMSLWSARFAVVCLHMLAVIPLVLITLRINQAVALLAAALYLFSPWLVATSRLVREYAVYPFFFFLTAWLMLRLYDSLPEDLVLRRDLRRLLTPANLVLAVLLVFVLVYAFIIDSQSTFRVVAALYPAFLVLLLLKLDWREQANRTLGLGLLALAVLALVLVLIRSGGVNFQISGQLNTYFLTLLYEQPPQQWYFQRPIISLLILALAVLSVGWVTRSSRAQLLLFLVYGVILLLFVFFSVKGEKPRYGVSLGYWHVFIMAAGLYAALLVLRRWLRPALAGMAAAVMLLFFWNIPQSFVPALHTASGYAPITEEFHANLDPSYAYLRLHAEPGDALVTADLFQMYLDWRRGLDFAAVYLYEYDHPETTQRIYDAIAAYPHGWIVLDYRRGYLWSQPLPFEDFDYAGKHVEFLDWHGDQYLFHWSESTPAP
ncbi:MAG: hypothetical protein ACK2UW_04340 [Anaerolineales bacterium]